MSAKEILDRINEIDRQINSKIKELKEEKSELEVLLYEEYCSMCFEQLCGDHSQCEGCGNVICLRNICGEYAPGEILLCRDCFDSLFLEEIEKEKEINA